MTGKWIAIFTAIKKAALAGCIGKMKPRIKVNGYIGLDDTFGAIYRPDDEGTAEIPLYLTKDKLPEALQILIDDLKEQKAELEQELNNL